eukprot:m.73551 g.73551  ORF g.73551 m.73551 type:complete len:664 (+) comp13039_c2_seq2:290-2281(+)
MSEYPSRPIHAGSQAVSAPAPPTVVPSSHVAHNPASSATMTNPHSTMAPTKPFNEQLTSDKDDRTTAPPILPHSVAPRPDASGTTLSVPGHQPILTATGGPDVTRRCDPLPPAIPLIPTPSSNVLDPASIAHPQNSTYDGTMNVEATGAAAHPFYLSKQTNAALANLGSEIAPVASETKLGDNSGPQHRPAASATGANSSSSSSGTGAGYAPAHTSILGAPAQSGSLGSASHITPADTAAGRTSPSSQSGDKDKKKKGLFFNTTLIHETKVPSHPLPDPARFGPAPVSHPAVLPAPVADNTPRQVIQSTGGVVPVTTVATPQDSYHVHLSHPNGEPLGMNICSEDLHFTGVYITEIDPYGIAAMSGKISRGLFIQAVNGKSTIELKHADIVRELALPEVDLLLSLHPFEKRASVIAPARGSVPVEASAQNIEPQSFSGERNVIIEKDDSEQLGITLQGIRGVCVSSITKGSPASKSTIQVDDKLIAVNGINVVNATIEEVVAIFRQSPKLLTLTVVTPITKRISALGVFSAPNLAKGGAVREEERTFAEQLDAAAPTSIAGTSAAPVTGPASTTNVRGSPPPANASYNSTPQTAPTHMPPPLAVAHPMPAQTQAHPPPAFQPQHVAPTSGAGSSLPQPIASSTVTTVTTTTQPGTAASRPYTH